MGIRNIKPLMIFHRPPNISDAVKETCPVIERATKIGSKVPKSPRLPLNSDRDAFFFICNVLSLMDK